MAEFAVQQGLFQALSGLGLTVYDVQPQAPDGGASAGFPCVTVGTIVFAPWDVKENTGFDFIARVHTWSRSGSMKEAKDIQTATQQQYASMTAKLGQSMLTGAGQARAAGTGMVAMGGGARALTMQVQNASYQVGDFFVQIASGTGAMRAMSQQLPQLLGGFGMWGSVAGAAVAIGGALVPMFLGAGEASKTFKQNLEEAEATLSKLKDTAAMFSAEGLEALKAKYGEVNLELIRFIDLQAQAAQMEAFKATQEAMTKLYDDMNNWTSAWGGNLETVLGELDSGGYGNGPIYLGCVSGDKGFGLFGPYIVRRGALPSDEVLGAVEALVLSYGTGLYPPDEPDYLDAPTGEYLLEGQTPARAVSWVLRAPAGEYLLLGEAATLATGQERDAPAGAYILNGLEPTLKQPATLVAPRGQLPAAWSSIDAPVVRSA